MLSSRKFYNEPSFIVLIIIVSFVLMFASISYIKIGTMGKSDFFILDVVPPFYWLDIAAIAGTMFFLTKYLDSSRSRTLFLLSAILLIIAFRMFFPVTFTTVPAYEPDATNYMNIVNSWATYGIDFGVEGNYQHNFPLSFLIGYTFVKLGMSVDSFFRIAPFVIYAIEIVVLYFLLKEMSPENKKVAAIGCFLFSFSSLGYWVSAHYCPDLLGSLFFLVCLYLAIKFVKNGQYNFKALAPLLVSTFVLILSHHLSTLFFIVTLFGLTLSTWFFKPKQFKGGALSFFLLGIYTYTLWFAYGTLEYPSFFNIYIYFSGFESLTALSAGAGTVNNILFAVYPAFVIGLFALGLFKALEIKSPKELTLIVTKIKEARTKQSNNLSLVFAAGFIFMVGLFFAGFIAPATQTTRVLEVLSIGMYPFAGETFLRFEGSPSNKKRMILLAILILVIMVAFFRYNSQIQRRIIAPAIGFS